MTRTEKKKKDRPALDKKNYHPPVVQVYGKLNRLTQGGSGPGFDVEGSENTRDT